MGILGEGVLAAVEGSGQCVSEPLLCLKAGKLIEFPHTVPNPNRRHRNQKKLEK
jgi:hypothetical protein